MGQRMPGAKYAARMKSRKTLLASLLSLAAIFVIVNPLDALMGGQGLMWSVLPDQPVKLVVCWLNASGANPLPGETATASGATRREWARLALKGSWERYGRVIFVGWGDCQDETHAAPPPHTLGPRRPGTADENIKVQITSTGASQNPAHGSWGDYQNPSVLLNLHCGNDNTNLKACIESLAIHEFGHVLGYYHEEERTDWPSTSQCPEQWSSRTPSDPWWPIPSETRWGAADTTSVMAYCSGGPTEVRPRDIAGEQRYYQRHLPGILLSVPGSLCLSSHADQPNGDPVFGWECDEAFDDQEWKFDPLKDALYIRRFSGGTWGPNRCLDVDTSNYTNVQTWDCNSNANQRWVFRRFLLRGYGGLCATRSASGFGGVTMEACTGFGAQLWRLVHSDVQGAFRLQSETGDLCLSGNATPMMPVSVERCDGSHVSFLPFVRKSVAAKAATQEAAASGLSLPGVVTGGSDQDFVLGAGGELRVSGQCLDVRAAWDSDYTSGKDGPQGGQLVQTFGCVAAQLNQKWNFSGDLMSGNKCLAVGGDATHNGARAMMARCDNSAQQDWDYYW